MNIVHLVVSVVLCTFVHSSLCVECWDYDYGTSVHGIGHIQDFIYCSNAQSKIVSYYACTIPYVMLPVQQIRKTFPSVHLINWACTAECQVNSIHPKIQVHGCTSGEY